ncbi:MAG: inositol monophosphatase [Phyllobacteriaceae bacterium]|nr:inositol monophosphatase [Phyllobacteriaceae bacterium]
MTDAPEKKQLLHLVFGGELKALNSTEFRDLDALVIVGVFPDFQSARAAWRAKAQETVDNALMRYYVVHLHRLLEPDEKG